MAVQCEMCGKGPAAVFTPSMALCKPCKRDADVFEREDGECDNAPTCAVDGSVLGRTGVCAECCVRGSQFGPAELVAS